ncbi:porin family protein [Flavobacterium sp. 17A]|uniref:Porin family protein n=1 Tax=Flavobacterium potami TaxID=2872310 RepID=A0A9X1HFR3_9FLAO|nr:porin family protein [Flavobacterium potami]MBZ4037678.1 porin family protein [Flavobacterium potami]
MKKIVLAAIAVMTFGFANAQEQTAKGKWLIEANTGFGVGDGIESLANTSFHLASSDGETAWGLGAEGGYFVADNLAVKAGLGYSDFGHSVNAFSYKVGAKYYLLNKFPLEASYTGASVKDADENPSFIGLQGGYAWFVGKNISIEPGLRYNISMNEDYSKDIFQFNIGFALHF